MTESRQKQWLLLKKILSTALLLFAVVLIGYYTLFPSRGYFHSDSTDTIMWAEASYESGSLFNPDFQYACLLPFSTTLIMTALIPLTGVSMTTHVLGMFCFFLLFAGALILLCRMMNWKLGWTSVGVFLTLMLISGSMKLREIFWGHTIYYSLGVWFIFVGLSLVFWYMNLTEQEDQKKCRNKLIVCLVLTTIWFFLACSDLVIALTIFAFPVIGAVFCERFFDRKTKWLSYRNFLALILLFLMIIGTVAGFVLTKIIARNIPTPYADAYSEYSDMSEWADNLQKFPTAWLSLLGVTIQKNEPLASVESVGTLLLIFTGILLLVLPLIALFCWKKIKDRKLRILILTYWFMTLLIMTGYIFGKLSAANWRLSPIVAMSAIVSIAFLRWAVSQTEWQRLASLLLVPVVVVGCMHSLTILSMPADNTSQNKLYTLTAELESRNLTYGYATFWNANCVTIISDSKVKCRSVEISNAGILVRPYQCNNNWYLDQPEQENYFLLMTSKESAEFLTSKSPVLSLPHEVQKFNNYELWIFEENIF